MVEMKVLVIRMMVMMIPMKSRAMMMMMMMAIISPLWEGISPTDFCLLESFSLFGVFCPTEAAVSISEPPGRWQKWARGLSPQGGTARG
jgi:hypothetical protein